MPRPQNSRNLESNDNESFEFDLGRYRQSRASNSRKKRPSGRPVIICLVLLLFLGIHMHHRKDTSRDRSTRALLADLHLTTESVDLIEAISPSATATEPPPAAVDHAGELAGGDDQTSRNPTPAKAATTSPDGWPFPDVIGKFEAPVISDATSSPATEPSLDQSKRTKNPLAESSKTKPVVPTFAIPISAFPTGERIWTRTSGKFLLASALAYDEHQGTIMLRSSDGRVLSSVAIEELCPADLEFLSQLTEFAANQALE